MTDDPPDWWREEEASDAAADAAHEKWLEEQVREYLAQQKRARGRPTTGRETKIIYFVLRAMLEKLVSKQTADTIELTNRVTNPDSEIINACRPGMATIPSAMLLCASSPYARRGELFRAFDRYYGKSGPLVCATVPQSFIDEETLKDPANAASEYGAEFRTDIEAFVNLDAVRACIDVGIRERAPDYRWKYYCFTDPSGGSGDSFTLAVAHREGNTVILDLVREIRPPFSPEQATEEFAAVARQYRCDQDLRRPLWR